MDTPSPQPEARNEKANRVHAWWLKIKKATGWLAPLLLVATVFLGIVEWFESRIEKAVEKKLNGEAFFRKIFVLGRPTITFFCRVSNSSEVGSKKFVKRNLMRKP